MDAVIAINQTTQAVSNLNNGVSIDTLISMFAASQDIKASSRDLYKRTLKRYFDWVEEKGYSLAAMSIRELIEYKEDLIARGMSSLTVSSYITSLRKFYEWGEANKFTPNIAIALHSPKRKQQFKKQHLEPEQATQLLEYSRSERAEGMAEAKIKREEVKGGAISEDKIADIKSHFASQSLRDYAIVNLMLRTGLRCIEVVRANIEDITFKSIPGRKPQRVLMVQGKGKDEKDDFVTLTDKAYKPIAEYLATRGKTNSNEPLFACTSNNNKGGRLTTKTISSLIKEGLRSIGLDDRCYTAHSLRHTAAVNILRATNWNIEIAQRTLRHTNPATTQIYTETAKEEEKLLNSGEKYLDKLY